MKDAEIKLKMPRYLREISLVLNQVPREMLLLLKINDLLRGIETCLQTRNSSSSFVTMTKCCVQLISSCEREAYKNYARRTEESKHAMLITSPVAVLTSQLFAKIADLKFYLRSYFRENLYLFKMFVFELLFE